MANTSQQASFIPKNTHKQKRTVRTTKRIYIISYLSYVFFFGTIAVVLGSYLYGIQVDKAVEIKKQELLDKESRFDDSHLAYVRDLEKRINTAEDLVNQSHAPSKLFSALEDSVVETALFDSFTYGEDENGQLVAEFSGNTDDFDNAIFQREVIAKNKILADAEVSEFKYGKDVGNDSSDGSSNKKTTDGAVNGVTFTYTAVLDPSTIAYDPSDYTDLQTEVGQARAGNTDTNNATTSTTTSSTNE